MDTGIDAKLKERYPSQIEDRKKSMMKKKRKRRVKRRFIIFVFLLICGGIILTVLKAPLFDIKDIVCVGQKKLSEQQIIKESGLKKNENIFIAGVTAAEEKLMENPEIKKVSVQRVFPNKIKISVTEAVPAAYAKINEKKVLIIDENGNIISNVENGEKTVTDNLIYVQGLDVVSETPGKKITADTDVRAENFFSCIATLKKIGMFGKVNYADFSDLSDIKLEYENRLEILLGDYDNMEYKLKFSKKVIDEKVSKHERAVINCRGEQIIVGPREEPVKEVVTTDEEAASEKAESDENEEQKNEVDAEQAATVDEETQNAENEE